ncbi:hypothetical protein AwWohl_02870 [Gammaproteobacteria bacterium]|nr:hypothetical protein AwWohl_02870 [Gammaproteobacteria bacterium]
MMIIGIIKIIKLRVYLINFKINLKTNLKINLFININGVLKKECNLGFIFCSASLS